MFEFLGADISQATKRLGETDTLPIEPVHDLYLDEKDADWFEDLPMS